MPDSEPRSRHQHAGPPRSSSSGSRTHPLTGLVQGCCGPARRCWPCSVSCSPAATARTACRSGSTCSCAWAAAWSLGITFGFLTWWFTRYLIDGTELRITSGILQKSSRRIPYERIQSVDIAEPFLARVIGLAELRIEMAGGSNCALDPAVPPARRRQAAAAAPAREGARTRRPRSWTPTPSSPSSSSSRASPPAGDARHRALARLPGRRSRQRRRAGGGPVVRPGARVPRRHHPAGHVAGADRRQARPDAVGLHPHPERRRAPHRARAALPHVAEHPVRAGARGRGRGAVRVAAARLAATGGRRRRLRLAGRAATPATSTPPCCRSPIRCWRLR